MSERLMVERSPIILGNRSSATGDEVVRLLPEIQSHVLSRSVSIPRWRAEAEERHRFESAVAQSLVELRFDREISQPLPDVARRLTAMMTGLGAFQPLLDVPGVEEIIVRDGWVQIEREGAIEDVGVLADDDHAERVARRAADQGGRAMKGDRPYVLADLPDGSRFTAIVPPLSVRGTAINVRVFDRDVMSLDRLVGLGAFDGEEEKDDGCQLETTESIRELPEFDVLPPVARFLARVAAENRATVLISGEFGAGKTTLLNAMSLHIPSYVQLAVVETFEELKIAHPHPLRVVVKEDRENYPSMDEVLNVVITRMRPDLLIIGEIVKGEAGRFLDAINLGKKAWSTIHGNDAYGALYRLETKALSTKLPHRAIREQIAAGVDLVVHLRRDRSGRRYVAQLARVAGLNGSGDYNLQFLYNLGEGGMARLDAVWEEVQ